MYAFINASALSWHLMSLVSDDKGTFDNVSAVNRSFPGRCVTVYHTLLSIVKIAGLEVVGSQRIFCSHLRYQCLKSLSMRMCIPKMYVDNFSPAHVFASASFSV